MRLLSKIKNFLPLAFLAIFLFLSVSIGGELLHERIHHHATQTEHDNCFIYQLQLQLFVLAAVFMAAAPFIFNMLVVITREVFCFNICRAFPNLRAPPASL